ncbi:hypothetical protein HPB51_026157 [Rhipicephalus microplus]|uniref:Uncharacterized protein n=1 Tax=Rhipicephalus microplus TaxID=6941 RepID=A0A9J6DR64_RHIMP|nr:hypothetical protein HPB51_026157 [Rhipicephalus microplus]
MASRQRRSHRGLSSRFEDFDASIQLGFGHAVCGGEGDFRERRDLRDELNFMRRHCLDLSRRKFTDACHARPSSGKRTHDSGEPQPREIETVVDIEVEHACSINAERESKRDEAAACATAHQTSADIVDSENTADHSWHSSVHHRPQPMHHEDALANDNRTSNRVQSSCTSEKQRTPKTNDSVPEKYFPLNSQVAFEYGEGRNTEEKNVFEQSNADEERHNMVPQINNCRVSHSQRPSIPNAMRGPPAFEMQETNHDRPLTRNRDHPEHSYTTVCPRIDAGVTGPKEQKLEEQQNVTSPQDRLQWRSFTTGRSDAERLGQQHQQYRPFHRRRTREQAIDADTESDDSEHGGKGTKLLSLEGEEHRLDQSSAGRQELSSEAPSRDESMMEDLMERFEEVYKQA